jgi:trehalose/maltose hydrolase-like predicted phosphorylase
VRTLDGWSLVYDGFDPSQEKLREALCVLGNGFFATRGAAPESVADAIHYPGTYAAGCYNRLDDEIAGRSVENESMVNLPNWLPLTFAVNGGEWFHPTRQELLGYQQVLDLRRGLLTRRFRVRDREGRETAITQRRLVHMGSPHLAALATTVTAENWTGRLRVRSAVDAAVENAGIERYRSLASRHLRTLETQTHEDTVLLVAQTTQSKVRVAVAARTSISVNGLRDSHHRRVIAGPDLVGHELAVELTAGDQVTVDKVIALYTSRDPAISEPGAAATEDLQSAGGFEALLESHALAWSHLWRRFNVNLSHAAEQYDHAVATSVRLGMFHLLQTVSPHSVDLDVGVPARGLHGEAYRGHVFWDELFVFPVLTLRLPAVTRAILLYRYRRLPAARRAAAEAGYAGAMFPWQSGSDGREESQRMHLNPLTNHWLPDVSHLQHHVGIAVAYTFWQYYESTDDREFLADYGAEMMIEIARFWASIASHDQSKDRFVIRGVMGPDEFHTGYPGTEPTGIDNNAYTNVMAAWVFRRALDSLRLLSASRRAELIERLDLQSEELQGWRRLSERMFVPFHDDGVISQFEGYADLEELDWDGYRARYPNLRRLDRILEAEGRSPNQFKVSKQADVVMLFYLLSSDELTDLLDGLGYDFEPATIPRTIEYYLARTCHGSTLSSAVHAWVLARLHRERAIEFFFEVLRSDTADIQGGTTAEGIHVAVMSSAVDLLQRCFAGVQARGDALWFDPHWPEVLGDLEFEIRYRGCELTVQVSGGRAQVTAAPDEGPPIKVGCRGATYELKPGGTIKLLRGHDPQAASG